MKAKGRAVNYQTLAADEYPLNLNHERREEAKRTSDLEFLAERASLEVLSKKASPRSSHFSRRLLIGKEKRTLFRVEIAPFFLIYFTHKLDWAKNGPIKIWIL